MNGRILKNVEETEIPEIPEIGKLQICNAVQPMVMECHEGLVEFLLLYSGYKRIWVENRRYDMQGGDLLVIFPKEKHGAEEDVQNRSSLCYFLMAVPTEIPGFCMLEEKERQALWERLRTLPSRKLQLPASARQQMDNLLASAYTEDPLATARVRVRLMEFLFQVLDAGAAQERQVPPDIAAAIHYIRERREEMPDISELAAFVNLSESRFKQKFKQATGVPPIEFMVRDKVQEAKLRLESSDQSVTAIAMELGFSSSQHFSVLFKKYVGESPARYRRTHGIVL